MWRVRKAADRRPDGGIEIMGKKDAGGFHAGSRHDGDGKSAPDGWKPNRDVSTTKSAPEPTDVAGFHWTGRGKA